MESVKTYSCQNCGSTMVFDIESQSLKCPNCGNEQIIKHDENKVVEHELTIHAKNLIKAEEKTSTSMECEGCGATVEVDATSTATTCPYCGSNYVLVKKQLDTLIPDGIVPFRVDKIEVGEIFHKWIKSRHFAPNELKNLYQADKIQGIYMPFWTFDAEVYAHYRAMGGEEYQETYEDSDGEIQTRTKVRWHHTSGYLDESFDDVLVRASNKLQSHLLDSMTYNTQNINSFSPDYMSGYCSEIYTIDLNTAHQTAKNIINNKMENLCEQDVLRRYDRVKNLNMDLSYKDETYKYVLLPVYSTSFYYKDKIYNVLINGQSGALYGEYPKSVFKIAATVIFVIFIVIIFVCIYNNL